MFNSVAVVRVSIFTKGQPDKNNEMPVILTPVAGTIPSKRTIAGTVAKNNGLEANKTYLISVNEVEPDPQYGRRFNWTALAEVTSSEIIDSVKSLGKGSIFNVVEFAETMPVAQVDEAAV